MSGDLNKIEIPTPCPMSWESMPGTDQVRFCDLCNKNVYNISAMPKKEGERLAQEHICGRIVRRSDGTVETAEPQRFFQVITRRAALAYATAMCWTIAAMASDKDRGALGGVVSTSFPPKALIVGARVTLKNSSNELIEKKTDKDGKFEFAELPFGVYELRVEAPWSSAFLRPGLRISGTVRQYIEVELQSEWVGLLH